MGVARVQNDCKTKWIPNICENEEKGGVTCEVLARADVWAPLPLPWSGAGCTDPPLEEAPVQVWKEKEQAA